MENVLRNDLESNFQIGDLVLFTHVDKTEFFGLITNIYNRNIDSQRIVRIAKVKFTDKSEALVPIFRLTIISKAKK